MLLSTKKLPKELLAIANGKPLIAMGHLHASGAELSEEDTAERPIIGGMESISPSSFPKALQYIALGHIHKAQALGDTHIRYAGSPIPLSFSEKHYTHQVVTFSIETDMYRASNLFLYLSIPLCSVFLSARFLLKRFYIFSQLYPKQQVRV